MALGPNPLAGGVIGSAWLKIGADPSGLKKGAAASQQSMLGMGLAAGSAGKQIAAMFGKYIGAAALIAAVKRSTAAFIEFDKHLRNTHTLITATEVELQKIGKGVRALARDFNVSAAASQASLYQIYSATFYGAEAMHILEEGAKGAVAGLAELKPTVDMLTTVLNAYRMSADQTTHINDLLFTAIRYGKTTLVELSHQFGRLAGVAAPVGASIEDMTAAIATLTRQGIMTDWAITSLRQTLMQFIKPTQNLKKALLALGYESGSAMVKHYGFAEALKKITAWAKENNVEMDQMFTNIRAITAVLPLATIAAGEYAKDQERMANAAGAAAVAFTKAERSIAYQLKKFTTLVNDMAISVGKVFVPALMMMVKAVETLVTPLRKGIELFDAIGGDYFIAIATGIGVLTVAVWALHKAFLAIAGSTAGVALGLAALRVSAFIGGGSLLAGAGLLGIGALGIGATIQAIVNLNLQPGAVAGEEKVKRTISDTLMSTLGPIVGGAVIGQLFVPGIGAAVGAAVGAIAALTINVIHEIKKAPLEIITPEEAKVLIEGAILPPEIGLPQTFLEKFLMAPFADLETLVSDLAMSILKVTEYTPDVDVLSKELLKYYDVLGQGRAVLKTQYLEALTIFKEFAGAFRPTLTDIEQMVDGLIESYKQAVDIGDEFMAAGFLSETQLLKLRAFLMGHIEVYHDALRQSAIEFGLTSKKIRVYVNVFAMAQAALFKAIETGQPLEALAPSIEGVIKGFQNMIAAFPREIQLQAVVDFLETISTYDITTMARIPSEWEAMILEILDITEAELAAFIVRYQGAIPSPEDIVPETIVTELAAAQKVWDTLVATLSDQNITTDEAIKTWGDMGAMLTKYSKLADIAESQTWECAEELRTFANMMDLVINALKKAATAFQKFIAELVVPTTAGGALAQAEQILEQMRAGGLNLQDLIAGGAGLGGLQTLLETARVGAYRGGALELVPEIDAALAELALAIGQTPEEIQAALEAAQRKADQAANEALQAAREAAAAQQKAFRDIFKTPILESLRSGDWMKAAEAIRIFAQSRNDLMSTAAALSTANDQVIDEAEVLQLIVGAQRELLATLDSMILAMQIAGEDASALEEMKYAIEDLFDPLGELKKKLREVVGVPIAKAGLAGEQFRALINVMLGRSTTVPSMRVGGMIEREGLFWGHAGEAVIPAEAVSSVAGGMEDMASTIRVCTGDVCYEIEQVAEAAQTLEECASNVCGKFEQVATSPQALTDIQAALAQASTGSVAALTDLLKAAEPGGETWNLVFDSMDEYRASIEGLISDYELIGESTDALEANLLNFDAAIQGLTPLLFKMKNALRDLLSSIGETIKSGLKELIRGFFSAGDAAESLGASLNVPTGYKVTRAAWAAAAPGIPGIARGAGEGFSLAEWATNLALEIVGALTDALVDFMWENFITPIIWEDLIVGILWEDFIVGFLWEKFIQPFIWTPIVMPAVTAIYNFVASLISGMATLRGFGAALVGLFTLFTGLGIVIGVVEAGLAFLWGAIQGVGDLLSAFFKPIIEAVGWAWEALTPLIDGARKLFGSLAPIMEIFGEVVAFGIRLITPLFSALGVALGFIGDVINTVAKMIKFAWDYSLGPVLTILAGSVALLANIFIIFANVISDIIKFLTFGLVNLGHTELIALPTLQGGGKILSEGFAYLHAGEIVAPAALTQPLGAGMGGDIIVDNTIMLDGSVLWHGMRRVNRKEERRKTGSSIGGRAWRSG